MRRAHRWTLTIRGRGSVFDKHRNSDGTYNGITLMAEISGLSQAEIRWTWERLRHLMHVEGRTKDEAKSIVRDEARARPWETT